MKILFGIYLFKQKIKMILMSIQSILMSKFLIVAMIYALSNTFKIWYDIKTEKHHHHDKVVYYENAHHQHHYEPPEHSEYDDHHHHGWGDWGRSIAVTEIPGNDPNIGVIGQQEAGVSRFIRRVSRTPQPMAEAQTMAFNAQRPSLEWKQLSPPLSPTTINLLFKNTRRLTFYNFQKELHFLFLIFIFKTKFIFVFKHSFMAKYVFRDSKTRKSTFD